MYSYGSETLSFQRQRSWLSAKRQMVVHYCLLVEHLNDRAVRQDESPEGEDISELNLLYPRSLYVRNGDDTYVDNIDLVTDAETVRRLLPGLDTGTPQGTGFRARLSVPDPKNPCFDLDLPQGIWHPKDTEIASPALSPAQLAVLDKWDLTFLKLKLGKPMRPGDSQWFFFRVVHDLEVVRTPVGLTSHVQVAYPLEVNNLAAELIDTTLNKVIANMAYSDEQEEEVPGLSTIQSASTSLQMSNFYKSLSQLMGVRSSEPVRVGLYELCIRFPNPRKFYPLSFHLERDISSRSDSPQMESNGELVFQFRSGETLRPRLQVTEEFSSFDVPAFEVPHSPGTDAQSHRKEGFHVSLVVACG
jgi:hypothetical protein